MFLERHDEITNYRLRRNERLELVGVTAGVMGLVLRRLMSTYWAYTPCFDQAMPSHFPTVPRGDKNTSSPGHQAA